MCHEAHQHLDKSLRGVAEQLRLPLQFVGAWLEPLVPELEVPRRLKLGGAPPLPGEDESVEFGLPGDFVKLEAILGLPPVGPQDEKPRGEFRRIVFVLGRRSFVPGQLGGR